MGDKEEKDIEEALKFQELKLQVGIIVSHYESERRTRTERNAGFDKALQQNREEMFRHTSEINNKYREVIYGDGSDAKPGLQIRIDRMEQIVKSVKFLWGVVVTLSSTVISGLILYLITKH